MGSHQPQYSDLQLKMDVNQSCKVGGSLVTSYLWLPLFGSHPSLILAFIVISSTLKSFVYASCKVVTLLR